MERLKQRLRDHLPADLSSLLKSLDEKMQSRPRGALRWVTASLGDTVKMFPIEEVLFFHSQDKYVRVVTANSEAVIRTPLKELLTQLDPEVFWQIHRSVIVRASAIDRVKRDALGHYQAKLRGLDETLPVSNAYQAKFRSM